jgi:hypothetical protein
MWPAGLLSDARPLDTGPAPRRNTEGGIQSADKSLINRRLKRSISCSVQILYQTTASICWIAASGVRCQVGAFYY